MAIKAVLFDFDDTLIDTSASREERIRRAYDRLHAEGIPVAWNTLWHAINDLDEDGFYRRGMEGAMDDLRLTGTTLGDECIGLWRFEGAEDLIVPSDGCIGCLEALTPHYRLGVLTNGPEASQKHKFAHSGLSEYFQFFLPSGEAGVQKPDPAFYHIALDRMGVTPAEAVFVGDHLDLDITGAHQAGMPGILYNPDNRRRPDPYIVPDAVLRHFGELPGVIERLARA